jgi:arabinofuranosyltransferase
VSEDAFIDLRVVDNLLAGHGPVFNPGERVEAYTNPLWVALLALWSGLGGRPEWGALALGLALTLAGLAAALAAAARLARADAAPAAPGVLLPAGAVVFAALPAVWDFATSGLETGLGFAWLGLGYLLAVRAVLEPGGRAGRAGAAALAGLAPLVRPDLALFGIAWLAVLALVPGPAGARPRAGRLAAVALALPLAYQAFRMGYFAAVVPNTALAKEAGLADWRRGLGYAHDLAAPYALWVPAAVLALWLAALVARSRRQGRSALAWLRVAPVLAALAHALYVIRVGGDFMHGRLLLPALLGALLPVAAVALPPGGTARRWAGLGAVLLAAWAAVCAAALRVPYAGQIGPRGIADERGFYVGLSARAHPVTTEDYAASAVAARGTAWRRRAEGPDPPAVLTPAGAVPLAPGGPAARRLVAATANIGLAGYLAGPAVHVADRHGLADPVAARLRLARRGRPAHDKLLPPAWIAARFGDPAAPADADVRAARAALRCGDLAVLLEAVEAPLTPARFVRNLGRAPRLHRLRVPPDPAEARAALCGPGA